MTTRSHTSSNASSHLREQASASSHDTLNLVNGLVPSATAIVRVGRARGPHCNWSRQPLGDPFLQEAGSTRQGLLEELESVVIIEDRDGVLQGGELLVAHLHVLIEKRLLLGAVLLQVLDELLVLQESLTGVTEVVLHLDDLHTKFASALELGLNVLASSLGLLRGGNVGAHLITHGLED